MLSGKFKEKEKEKWPASKQRLRLFCFVLNIMHLSWPDGVKGGKSDLSFSFVFESCRINLSESFHLFGAQIFLLLQNSNSKHLYLPRARHYSKPFIFDHLIL